jgi:hypothetical protein
MAATISKSTRRAILSAPTRQLQAVANHRVDRLHTDSETDFLLAVLTELGRRSLRCSRSEVPHVSA